MKVFAFFVICCVFTGCANPAVIKTGRDHSTVMCENLKKRGNSIDPDNVTNGHIKGNGKIVFVFTDWWDLTPNRNYTAKWEWYNPNNYLIHKSSHNFTPTASNWKIWGGLKTDLKHNWPTGLWSVKMYINGNFVSEKKFILADNEKELAELSAKFSSELELEPGAKKEGIKQDQGTGTMISDSLDSITTGQSWAIIIGISEYKFAGQHGLKNLLFADEDARTFAYALKNLGWNESHLKLLVNKEATQRNIKIALESWLTKAGPNDKIVLFWAGHGFPDPEDPERVYFACYDTEISIPATGYRMDRVRATLEERKSRNVILFADTCHAGKIITRGVRGLSIVPQIDKMRLKKDIPKGWIFMVSADTDRQAIEHSSWTNGAFTHCLINALTGAADGYQSAGPKDGTVTMGEIRAYLTSVMPEETQKILGVAKWPVITTGTGDIDIWKLTLQAR